jgi:glyoxylase-like metal-dependent hydrolase (beta-lactamase superfamily II)
MASAGVSSYHTSMRLSPSCYAVPGLCCIPPWWHNAGFVVGGSRTLVVDTGGNLAAAQTIHGYATAVSSGQPLLAVNTEPHLDHLLGNAFFRARGVEILGHASIARTEADLARYEEEVRSCIPDPARRARREERSFFAATTLLNPTRPVTEDVTLDLGGLEAALVLTPGHTPANLCVFVPAERVLYAGDCLEPGYLPGLEEGDPDAWRQWLSSLDRIEALAPIVAVPGHGPVLDGAAAVQEELERVREVLREAIRRGAPPTDG